MVVSIGGKSKQQQELESQIQGGTAHILVVTSSHGQIAQRFTSRIKIQPDLCARNQITT